MFEKRIPLKTHLEALKGLTFESLETHFDLVVRQLVGVSEIAEAWKRLRHCYRSMRGRKRELAARPIVEEIFRYVREVDKLLVERLDYLDPSAVGTDRHTERMDVELDAFHTAMATFAIRPVRALNVVSSSAFAASQSLIEVIHNRLLLAEREYRGNVAALNWHPTDSDIDFEHLSKHYPQWFDFDFNYYHSLLVLERARATKFLLLHRHRLTGQSPTDDRSSPHTCSLPHFDSIPSGQAGATRFHNWVAQAITLLAPTSLRKQAREYRIDNGRKRIDLVFTNLAKEGFFHRLDSRLKVFAPFVFVECKNLAGDPKNPDFDQLTCRFSDRRGHFGLLVCRNVRNRRAATDRARDIRTSNRGMVIVLAADEIQRLIDQPPEQRFDRFESLLEQRYQELVM